MAKSSYSYYSMLMVLLLSALFLSGCAGTVPTNAYVAQNFVKQNGKIDIGTFTYKPYLEGKKVKKPNQLQNTAGGSLYISTDVADYVKRGTALELEKSGVEITDLAPIKLDANVLEFKADDLGYSVTWSYSIQYIIRNKASNEIAFDKVFTPTPKKTGKFGMASDYSSIVSDSVLAGYDLFIRDPETKRLLMQSATPPPAPSQGKYRVINK